MTSETKARAWEMAARLIVDHAWEYSKGAVLAHAEYVVSRSLKRQAARIRARAKTTHAAKKGRRP